MLSINLDYNTECISCRGRSELYETSHCKNTLQYSHQILYLSV